MDSFSAAGTSGSGATNVVWRLSSGNAWPTPAALDFEAQNNVPAMEAMGRGLAASEMKRKPLHVCEYSFGTLFFIRRCERYRWSITSSQCCGYRVLSAIDFAQVGASCKVLCNRTN